MRTLQPDLDGDDVKQWQEFLIGQGLLEAGSAIGHFGPKTEQATKDFQAKHGLEVDGLVGPNTLAQAQTLNFIPPPEPASSLNSSSEAILQSVHPELARLLRVLAAQVAVRMQCVVASGYRTF
jgi:peptidoglycan hydrolase-like protein with peptidoglycan-binding domain